MVFAKKDLLRPIHFSDRHLLNILGAFCEEALSRRKTPVTPTRAKKVLLEVLPQSFPPLQSRRGENGL
jgi:hypothetical protein